MKSQIEVMPFVNSHQRTEGRRTNTGQTRQNKSVSRVQSTKNSRNISKVQQRKKARKRRRLQRIYLMFRCTLVLSILLLAGVLALKIFHTVSAEPAGLKEEEVHYEVGTPQVLEESEVSTKIKSLAEQYPEFTDIYENIDAYPEDLMSSLANNPEMIDFVKGYLTSDGSVTGGLTDAELSEDVPLLIQWDTRWGYASYGDNDIALSGCAPTCLSMVAVALTGNAKATPDAVAEFAMSNGYYEVGTGTMWSLMTDGCLNFGIQGQELSLAESVIVSELEAGHPIICSVRPGDFTTAGHFIVLAGVEDGKIRVNDPNSKERSSKLWDYATLEGQIKNLWAFTQS